MALQHPRQRRGNPQNAPALNPALSRTTTAANPSHPSWSQLAGCCSAFCQPQFAFFIFCLIESPVQYIWGFLHRSVWLRGTKFISCRWLDGCQEAWWWWWWWGQREKKTDKGREKRRSWIALVIQAERCMEGRVRLKWRRQQCVCFCVCVCLCAHVCHISLNCYIIFK